MADGLNRVHVGGYLGADPELRITQGGSAVMSMSIACNESYLDRNRVRQERVEWVKVVVWGKRAEGLAKFLRKGAMLFVEGSLRTTSYEDREGIKRWKTEVVARNVYLAGGAKARNAPDDPERRRPSRRDHYEGDRDAPAQGGGAGYDDADYGAGGGDDDIPF